MQADPVLEWRRLTEHYRQMRDGELRELAANFDDLTDTAKQALRTEFRSRGFGDPSAMPDPRWWKLSPLPSGSNEMEEPNSSRGTGAFWFTPGSRVADLGEMPTDDDSEPSEDSPREFTWKVPLCECDESIEAWQLGEALRRAGIECWVEWARNWDRRYTRILVPADKLDEAHAIANRPIPQEIVDESKIVVPEFETPVCPRCRAADPVLRGVDPSNLWHCDACGTEWSDPGANQAGDGEDEAKKCL
jgi:ribosomal protein L37AE/L43A